MALVNKGVTLGQLGRTDEAEVALQKAAAAGATGAWNSLGNLLLDRTGNPTGAVAAYETGLAIEETPRGRAMLHSKCAYALALYSSELSRALDHAEQALAEGESLSPAGRQLLRALLHLREPPTRRWPGVFEQIGRAVESQDADLWATHLDDLQRLLWLAVAEGQGESLRHWMDQAQYSLRYAPLYHAIIAAIDGEDHLLKINPETRQAAAHIHEGVARQLKLYGRRSRRN